MKCGWCYQPFTLSTARDEKAFCTMRCEEMAAATPAERATLQHLEELEQKFNERRL